MTRLTISIDDAIVRRARVRASEEGTSVNAKVRESLAAYAQCEESQQMAAQAFITAARRSQANRDGVRWPCEDAQARSRPMNKRNGGRA